MELKDTKRQLALLADRTVANMQKSVKQQGKFNTGQLYRSIGWRFVPSGIVFFINAPYSTYVLKGRRKGAKMPPKQAIQFNRRIQEQGTYNIFTGIPH